MNLAEKVIAAESSICGVSYRQWLAGICLQGILSKGNVVINPDSHGEAFKRNARLAVMMADALIKELEQTRG